MTISELIEILEKIKEENGDLIVTYAYNDCGYVLQGEEVVTEFEIETKNGEAVFVRLM